MQPRVVHVNSVSNLVENITFMHCPPDRRITVPVPVQVRMLCSCLCFLLLVVAVTCLCLSAYQQLSFTTLHLPTSCNVEFRCCQVWSQSNCTQQYVCAPAICLCMYIFQVIGEDACPGLKQNGFPYLIRRTVECLCPGDAIPATIEVDIRGLNLGQTVLLPHLKLPSGVKLVAPVPLWLCQCLMAHVLPAPLLLPLLLPSSCMRYLMLHVDFS